MTPARRLANQRYEQRNKSRRSVTLADTNVEKTRTNTMRRALILLRLFNSRYWVSYDDIRRELGGVSHKTARRWVKAIEDAGWPLTSEFIDTGKPGGQPAHFHLLRRGDHS